MRIHFREKKFDISEIIRVFCVFLFYFVLVSCFYSSGYSYDLIPQVYVRQLIPQIEQMITMSLLLEVGVVMFAFSMATNLYIDLFNDYYAKENFLSFIRNLIIKIVKPYNYDGLDISNPFLYANKTRGLLE